MNASTSMTGNGKAMIRVGVLSECQRKLSLIFRANGYDELTSQLYKLQDLKVAISAYNILA